MRITFIVITLVLFGLLSQTATINKTNYPDNCPEVLEEPYSLVHSKWFYNPIPVKYALKYQTFIIKY